MSLITYANWILPAALLLLLNAACRGSETGGVALSAKLNTPQANPTATAPVMHTPDEVLGSGKYTIRPVVADPVSQQPWELKPYRLLIYDGDKAVADYEGLTDSEGHTLTVRSSKPIADTDISARPVIGTGGYKGFFRFESPDGRVKNQRYLFSFGGRVFVGISDEQGNTVEVRFGESLPINIYPLTLNEPSIWQEEAAILNRTLDAKTPEERIALLEQAIAYGRKHGGDRASVAAVSGLALLKAELANALLAPAALPAVEERLVTLVSNDYSWEDGPKAEKPIAISAAKHLDAIVKVLKMEKEAGATSFDPHSPIVQQAITLSQNLSVGERASSTGALLSLSRLLLDAHDPDLAEQILHANGFDENIVDGTDGASLLEMQSEVALSRGDTNRAQEMFALASFVHATDQAQSDDKQAEPDLLAGLRKRFPEIGPKTMLVSSETIAELRKQCITGFPDGPAFFIGKNPDSFDDNASTSIKDLKTISAIDAILTHGTLATGSYLRGATCEGSTARRVTVTSNDLKMVRSLSMIGPMLMLPDAKESQMPSDAVAHLGDVLAVFLEHSQLPPGQYEMNKTLEKIDLKIM
jgi:hypothetical protein